MNIHELIESLQQAAKELGDRPVPVRFSGTNKLNGETWHFSGADQVWTKPDFSEICVHIR